MTAGSHERPDFDPLLTEIAEYTVGAEIQSEEAYRTARYALMDALACAFLALKHPECRKHLGPVVPGTVVPGGARVPGTQFVLDPVTAAFNITCLVRWFDYNDTWLAADWGHPSDNLGGILATADYLSRRRVALGQAPLTMREILTAMIKAYEIQGVLALDNAFNRVGLDHVLLVKVASTAVVTGLLGGSREDVASALSHAWIDSASLRTYRHAPNTGPRKSWAAADATARGVWLALMTMKGETGYPTALSAKTWGFQDVLFRGRPVTLARPLSSYVMENVLFKISFPAEFHAQTAAECALKLHPEAIARFDEIERIELTTQEPAIRIIDKRGPLRNFADRDHCLQYIVAIGLIFGEITAAHYEDAIAQDPRIDALREKMVVIEDERYSRDYLDPEKRSIANAVQIFYRDGTRSEKVEVEYPIGHRMRRSEGIPKMMEKFRASLEAAFPARQRREIEALFEDDDAFAATPVHVFMEKLVL